jgi:hypothetical protein
MRRRKLPVGIVLCLWGLVGDRLQQSAGVVTYSNNRIAIDQNATPSKLRTFFRDWAV